MEKNELLPCPFCGCETVRVFKIFEQRGYAVDCNRCNGGFHNVDRESGIRAWNTRSHINKEGSDNV